MRIKRLRRSQIRLSWGGITSVTDIGNAIIEVPKRFRGGDERAVFDGEAGSDEEREEARRKAMR